MSRRLRIQFEGAKYHVINRGYRAERHQTLPARSVRNVRAAQVFLTVLDEAASRYAGRGRKRAFRIFRFGESLVLR